MTLLSVIVDIARDHGLQSQARQDSVARAAGSR
jgi:hypothetical protein